MSDFAEALCGIVWPGVAEVLGEILGKFLVAIS